MQSLPHSAKTENMNLNAQPNIRLAFDDWNVGHILRAQMRALKIF